MGGGKSQSEKLLTKKQIFRDLRGKLDTAAKIPGFFDVGQKVVSWNSPLLKTPSFCGRVIVSEQFNAVCHNLRLFTWI